MLPQELIGAVRLGDALALAQGRVRDDPGSVRHRIALFQLHCLGGSWEKALVQLDVVAELDASHLLLKAIYGQAIRCEPFRGDVFAGLRSPLVLGEPPEWLGYLLQANQVAGAGDRAGAAELAGRALEMAPTVAGTVDGREFEWIMDADQRLGPVIEALVNGRYYWIPLERIRRIDIEPPSDLHDLVWVQANFTWDNGGSAGGLIPARYPGTEISGDLELQLGRKTLWEERSPGFHIGLGQRLFADGEREFPILEMRRIELRSQAETGGAGGV